VIPREASIHPALVVVIIVIIIIIIGSISSIIIVLLVLDFSIFRLPFVMLLQPVHFVGVAHVPQTLAM